MEAAPPIVPAGTVIGRLQGPLTALDAFRDTALIAPACHDTASAIAAIGADLSNSAYICSGTWSLVGTVVDTPITSRAAMNARFTNQAAAAEGFCCHTNVNGMWLLKQCMEGWSGAGRTWTIEDLIAQVGACAAIPGVIDVDAEPLLLAGDMPARINRQLKFRGLAIISDKPGNEAVFARVIFESLARRYADALRSLEFLVNRKFTRIHILGGGSRNRLLTLLTHGTTGLQIDSGEVESSTIGNFAVQLAAAEGESGRLSAEAVRQWASRLCEKSQRPQAKTATPPTA